MTPNYPSGPATHPQNFPPLDTRPHPLQAGSSDSTRARVSFFSLLLEQFHTPERVVEELRRRTADHPIDARLDLQVFLNVMGREVESFAVSNQLLNLAPNDPRALFNHGWHWLKRGELRQRSRAPRIWSTAEKLWQ